MAEKANSSTMVAGMMNPMTGGMGMMNPMMGE